MGRQPRSGDIPWLSAHSILNWIGGDTSMLAPLASKSRPFRRPCTYLAATAQFGTRLIPASDRVDTGARRMLILMVLQPSSLEFNQLGNYGRDAPATRRITARVHTHDHLHGPAVWPVRGTRS